MSAPSFREEIGGWFTHRGRVQTPTHRLLDGGNLAVTDMAAFYEAYAHAVLREEKIYVVELKTEPTFNMFFDGDIHTTTDLDAAWCERFAKYVVGAVSELFSESIDAGQLQMVVSKAEPKATRKNNVDCSKYGVHTVFPSLQVNRDMALRIRHAVVQKLSNNMECTGPTRWEDDIDEVVYGANGLRMPFSRKMMRCKCTIKDRDACAQCFGRGTRDEGRPYVPFFAIDSDMRIRHYAPMTRPDEVLAFVRDTSIRSERAKPSHAFNAMPPCWFEDPDGIEITRGKPAAAGGGKRRRPLTEGHAAVESTMAEKVALPQSDVDAIDAFLQTAVRRKVLPREYKNVKIQSAFSFSWNGIRSNIICRLDSQYCMNIGRNHSTNTVYFEVNTNMRQGVMRCYCRCETAEGRRKIGFNGKILKCKEYRSDPLDTSDLSVTLSNVDDRPRKRIVAML
jgi:hypothetical protein